MTDLDFGFTKPQTSSKIVADVWFDGNANGVRDRGEEPYSGSIFLDLNNNGRHEPDEPKQIARPNAEFDVVPGTYTVRPALERGIISTFPNGRFEIHENEIFPIGEPGSKVVEAFITNLSSHQRRRTIAANVPRTSPLPPFGRRQKYRSSATTTLKVIRSSSNFSAKRTVTAATF